MKTLFIGKVKEDEGFCLIYVENKTRGVTSATH